MPACGLRRGSSGGPMQPSFISSSSRPSRGAKPRAADDARLPQERPHQAGSRGGGEINAGVPREEPVTQAMTIETRRAPACAVSLFPFGAKGASTGQHIGQRLPFGATRPRPAEWQDGGHRGAQGSITIRAFGSRRPPFVRITCTRCSPSKWPIVGALPAQYLGRGLGPSPINRTSHPQGRGIERSNWIRTQDTHRERRLNPPSSSSHQPRTDPREAVLPLYYSSSA